MPKSSVEVPRKEFSAEEAIDRIDAGQRVVVTVDVMGASRDVTLRKTDDEYVCDTGLKLLSYDDRDGLKACIERLRLVESD
jgi:hypothetical protein